MSQQKQLVIIDGHALAFRSFHALSSVGFRSAQGEPTYAVYGFVHSLLTLLHERQPDYLAVAFDVGKTFRHEAYPEYKAKRAETPQEFHPQLARIQHIVRALGIPIYTAEGYEADDVIGTLAQQATAANINTLILTGDTDTLQLVDDHVHVLLANPQSRSLSSTLYTVEKVRERYKGLTPGQLADLRGLKGDSSDNIPGVKGIGETGAIQLLNEYHTIERLYEHLDDVPNRYRKKLEGAQEQARESKYLAQIVCDVPGVTLDVDAATMGEYNRDEVIRLFQELEFRTLVEKLPHSGGHVPDVGVGSLPVQDVPRLGQHDMFAPPPLPTVAAASSDPAAPHGMAQLSMFSTTEDSALAIQRTPHGDYAAVVTADALHELAGVLERAPAFAFDTESTGVRLFDSSLVGISLAVEPGTAWYIPCGHQQGEQLPCEQVIETLRDLFTDPNKPKYAHNAKFDIEMLRQAGIETQGVAFDTMIAAGLLNKRIGLKDLSFSELQLQEPLHPIEDLIGRGAKQITFDYVAIEQATPYAAADADMTLRLVHALRPQLAEYPHIQQVFDNIEMPLVPVLVDIEWAGIKLDLDYLDMLSTRLGSDIASLEESIYQQAGERFNINSTIQLNNILFERLKLPTTGLSKTSSGRYSLAAGALETLSDSHEIVRLILHYRHLAKLKSTYVDALPKLVNTATGRIHTSFHQMGTSTGRLASSSPNLQNIPVRTDDGNAIRRAFVAEPGHVFVAADYSQIELRVLAHISQDPNLVQAFQEGQDIHAATAALLFGVPVEAVEKHQRRLAKTTVFGIIYGISSYGLSQRTEMSRSEAQELIAAFFRQFPGVRDYIDKTLAGGRTSGYVSSLFGRRRTMPDLNIRGPRRQAAEREAINAPIQATAADIMKLAMIHVARELSRHNVHATMVLQVHDELIFEAPEGEAAQVQQIVRDAMEQVYTLNVPLKVDVEVGNNWEQMHEVQEPT